jgi:hypothetical protein
VARRLGDGAGAVERASQCALLRDLFGVPSPPPSETASALAGCGGAVVKLAGSVYHAGGCSPPRTGVLALGVPFRPVTLDRAWLAADVLSLAEAAYEQRTLPAGTLDPARLAVLADALEDAGCASADLLDHLRGEGPHVRGAGRSTPSWASSEQGTAGPRHPVLTVRVARSRSPHRCCDPGEKASKRTPLPVAVETLFS